jgi:abortive infection bacteriophage resistance protein
MSSPFSSIERQIELLRDRGLEFSGEEESELGRFLLDVNYYRGSGYWRLFYNDPNDSYSGFRPNVTFRQIKRLYDWDVELRRLLMSGLALYEITFRARFAHYFAMFCEPDSYRKSSTFNQVYRSTSGGMVSLRKSTLDAINRDLKNSVEPAIVQALNNQQTPPIWISIECLSMGTMSKMYSVAQDDIRFKLSKSLKLPSPELAESLFHALTVFRNYLAHHGQVWHYIPRFPPRVLNSLKVEADTSIYERTAWSLIVSLVQQLEAIDPITDWSTKILGHINREPELKLGLTHPWY